MKYAITIFALSLSLAITGCGSDGTGTGNGGGGNGGGGTDAGGGGGMDTGGGTVDIGGGGATLNPGCELTEAVEPPEPEASCDDPACPCGTVINQVTGLVQDINGDGISGAKAQICSRSAKDGSTVCLAPVDTAADGTFFLAVPDDNTCMYESVMRALVPNQAYSTSYCTITGDDLAAPGGVLDLSPNPTVLYALTPAADAPDYVPDANGADDWDATYTVVFEDGLEIDVVPSWYFNGAIGHKSMAATYIEGLDHLCNGHEIEGAPGTWSISPEGDVFQLNYAARIPDKLGLPDGTEVKLYLQGGIGHTLWDGEVKAECREAEWRHFACATVENGVITLDAGTGLPSIGWLTYVPVE